MSLTKSKARYCSASMSPDGLYRYDLARTWVEPGADNADAYVVFIGLNPSTADEEYDDPTIRKCMEFARAWGMGGMVMVNLFAFRSTDPMALLGTPDPVGPETDEHIQDACRMSQRVIACWGSWPNQYGFGSRAKAVRQLVKDLYALKFNNDGTPGHPLYLKNTALPQPWSSA